MKIKTFEVAIPSPCIPLPIEEENLITGVII